MYCYTNKTYNLSGLDFTIKVLKERQEYDKLLPNYIKNFFIHIKNEIDYCTDKKLIAKMISNIKDKDLFIAKLDAFLEKRIDEFLDIKDECDEDDIVDY